MRNKEEATAEPDCDFALELPRMETSVRLGRKMESLAGQFTKSRRMSSTVSRPICGIARNACANLF